MKEKTQIDVTNDETINTKSELDVLAGLRPKLTVFNFAALIQQGVIQAEIAKLFKLTTQAVSDYKIRHANEIYNLLQPDSYYALKFKSECANILDSITQKDRKKATLAQKAVAASICAEKYRLLSDQSTENISLRIKPSEIAGLTQLADGYAKKIIDSQRGNMIEHKEI